ncbi:MAG: LysM peptidoglycan-binding domain-containing protein [Peptococcaceae bacterium]|nr:LysM peptidoglycan-binding domain-containing protein [Peptococcaceae bacterium]
MALWSHRVRAGETVYQIALDYNSSVPDIVRASGLPDANWVLPGQNLLVPSPDFAYSAAELHAWAKLLYVAYAAPLSELTAITQYEYQQVVWDDLEAKNVLARITRDEREHLNTLAQILKNLGYEPRYWIMDDAPVYWDACLIDYTPDPAAILAADIRSEQHAVNAYQQVLTQIPERFIRKRIAHILHEELAHIKEFERLLGRLTASSR